MSPSKPMFVFWLLLPIFDPPAAEGAVWEPGNSVRLELLQRPPLLRRDEVSGSECLLGLLLLHGAGVALSEDTAGQGPLRLPLFSRGGVVEWKGPTGSELLGLFWLGDCLVGHGW